MVALRCSYCWVELAFADLPASSLHLLTFLYNRGWVLLICLLIIYGKFLYLNFVTNLLNVAIWQVLKLAYFIHYIILTLYYYLT